MGLDRPGRSLQTLSGVLECAGAKHETLLRMLQSAADPAADFLTPYFEGGARNMILTWRLPFLASVASLLTSLRATFAPHRTSCSATFAPRQTSFRAPCAPLLTPLGAPYAPLLTSLRARLRAGGRVRGRSGLLSLGI